MADPKTALQFVGPCGHGKSTHLLAITAMIPDAPYIYLPEDGPHPPIPTHRPLLIDEAQRLEIRERRSIFRAGGPLVLGTHDDLSEELVRFGFHVSTVPVAIGRSPDQLVKILNTRIDAFRLSNSDVPRVEHDQAVALLREYGSNIRLIEQFLYDEFQTAVQKELPWPTAT